MRQPVVPSTPTMSRVNVTPIIDVALTLVIILLITAPMLAVRNMDLTLPEAESRGQEDHSPMMITVGRDGEMALDENLISPAGLEATLRDKLLEKGNDVLVVVRADEALPHSQIQDILHDVRAAGATRLAIATRQGRGEIR